MPVGSSSQQFIVRFKKLKIPRRRLEGVESFEALNSILYQMVLENKDRRWINFKGLFSLDIDIDIPVRFVPLKKT